MSRLALRIEKLVAAVGSSAGPALAEQVLLRPPTERRDWLLVNTRPPRFAVLNALLDRAYDCLDDAPTESLAIAEMVLSIIEGVPAGAFRDEFLEIVHGRAWQERANALRQMGDLLASRTAWQKAARIFTDAQNAELELAGAKRGEALVRHQLGESETALAMLRQTTQVCATHGDSAGVARCLLYEGVVHFENDRYSEAAATFNSARELAQRLADEKTVARLHLNLGNCALEQRDRAGALRHFAAALPYFERAGMLADRKRVLWAMAQMLADDGLIDRAVHALEDVAAEMELSGLPVDAALARRDIVEVLVLADRSQHAAQLARGVLETLAKAGLFDEALWTVVLLQRAESESSQRRGDQS